MSLTGYLELEGNINEQIELFSSVINRNVEFRQAILDKNWEQINSAINDLNELSIDIQKYELDRIEILINISKKINSKESENLLTIINKAPNDIKNRLLDCFYKLKVAILQAKGVFQGLEKFIEHKKSVSKEIIDVLVKDAKGNVYSKPGRKESDGQGFLLNRQL